MMYGIDIHPDYQAGIDFAKLKAQGYTFASVKATQGTTFTVGLFADWVARIRAAGMIPGGYHWINAGDGAAQARYFHNHLAAVGGPEGLLIQLDCEDNATLADVQAWAAEWRRLTAWHPFLMYTGGWWWRPRGWNGAAITPYLWDSHYLTADLDTIPDDPASFAARIPADWWAPGYGGWSAATFLQFTSRGDAGGLGNRVDLNATRLTREQLLRLTTAGGDSMTPQEYLAIINDPAVHFQEKATPWQYVGGGIPAGMSTLGVLNEIVLTVRSIAAKVDIGPTELAAITAAVQAGVAASADDLVAAIVAKLPPDQDLTKADVVTAVRSVFADAGTP